MGTMKCLFCEIISKEKEAFIIAESELAIAILDVFPLSDGHILLVSKQHFANVSEVNERTWNELLPLMKKIIDKLKVVFQPQGFNIISNIGEIASQSIFHLHLHIVPKYTKEKGFIWTSKPELKYNLDQVAEKLK